MTIPGRRGLPLPRLHGADVEEMAEHAEIGFLRAALEHEPRKDRLGPTCHHEAAPAANVERRRGSPASVDSWLMRLLLVRGRATPLLCEPIEALARVGSTSVGSPYPCGHWRVPVTDPSQTHTDLPLPRSANGASAGRRCGDAITASLCTSESRWSPNRRQVPRRDRRSRRAERARGRT